MRVIGGKDIPGTGGVLGAFVARIYPGGVADRAGDIREGIYFLFERCMTVFLFLHPIYDTHSREQH